MSENLPRLIYIPILHAREEVVDHKTAVLSGKGENRLASPGAAAGRPALDEMWAGIAAKIEGLNLPWNQTRIYQDGLPVCGEELKIVARLADNGSRNHLLIMDWLRKGAKLEGTEDLDLLIKEYDLLNVFFMKNSGPSFAKGSTMASADPSPIARRGETTGERATALTEYKTKSRELLEIRDQFVFKRIQSTIQNGEIPLVLMGVMHRLDKLLEKDFLISYIIYRLPFHSVDAIYNA